MLLTASLDMDKHQTAALIAKYIESVIGGCTAKRSEYGPPDASRPAEISVTLDGDWLILYVYDDKFMLYDFRSRFAGLAGSKYSGLAPQDFSISDPKSVDDLIDAIREHFRAS